MSYAQYLKYDESKLLTCPLMDIGKAFKLETYSDFYEKSHFFSQIFVNNKDELSSKLLSLVERDDLVFRGINEAKYKLYNSMQRFNFLHYKDMNYTYIDLLSTLFNVFESFDSGVLKYLVERQNDNRKLNVLSCFSYLQHYGCPTPFLDWTYNLNSALFFSTDGVNDMENINSDVNSITNYISIYVAHKELISRFSFQKDLSEALEKVDIPLTYDFLDELLEKFVDKDTLKEAEKIVRKRKQIRFMDSCIERILSVDTLLKSKLLFISDKEVNEYIRISVSNNLNILNQEGAFLFNSHPFAPIEWVVEKHYPMPSIETKPELLYSINIHKSLLNEIQSYLIEKNYCKDRIYPDPYQMSQQVIKNAISQLHSR